MVYLTDKVDGNRISDDVRGQHTETIDLAAARAALPADAVCATRNNIAWNRLCDVLDRDIGPRVTDVVYRPGDVAIVGQIGDGPIRWVRHSFL